MKPSRADKSRWNQREWLAVPSWSRNCLQSNQICEWKRKFNGRVRDRQGAKRGMGLTI
jgi:hypothetical protein